MPNSHALMTSVQVEPLDFAHHVKTGEELMAENPYRPWPARITSITDLTATEKLFEFRLIDERIRSAFHQDPRPVRRVVHLRGGRGSDLYLLGPF